MYGVVCSVAVVVGGGSGRAVSCETNLFSVAHKRGIQFERDSVLIWAMGAHAHGGERECRCGDA